MQVVAPGVADAGVKALDSGLGLLPVGAEFHLAAHGLLRLAQRGFVAFEAIERCVDRAIAQGGEAGNTEVDANGSALRQRGFHFTAGLDRDMPFARAQADGDVAQLAEHRPTVAIAQPAQLGQKDPAVGLIQLDLLRVGVTEAVALALALEAWEVGALLEEVPVGFFEVFEGMLQRMNGRFFQPDRFGAVAPGGQLPGHRHIADELAAGFAVGLLQRQGLVEHEPTGAGEAVHQALLFAGRHQFVFESLESLHAQHYTLGLWALKTILDAVDTASS